MKAIVFMAIFVIALLAFGYCLLIDMTQPRPDPFADCVPLPSNDTTNYWACKK